MADTYPHWLFDDSEIPDPFGYGERAVQFIRANRHPKSKLPKHAFELLEFQERLVRAIYGPRHPDGSRIVRRVPIMLPRGARKTALGAILGGLHHYGPEGNAGDQIILAAYDRDQARIAYEELASIIRQHPKVRNRNRILDSRHIIKNKDDGRMLKAVSSDANAQNGRTPSFVLIDEIHAWKKPDLYRVLRTGLSKTPGTLEIIISQAGRGTDNIAHEVFDMARKVASGEKINPAILPVLFETAPDADWRDEAVWYRANPGLKHGFPDIEALRQEALEAEHSPLMRDAFKNDHLNIWLGKSVSPLIDMDIFDAGKRKDIDFDELAETPCFLGVDLSRSGDLTAIVAAWRRDDGSIVVKPEFFLPDGELQRRSDRDRAPYVRWRDDGFLNTIPGTIIEPEQVEAKIRDLCAANDVHEVAVDPALAGPMLKRLVADGIPAFEYRQTPLLMGLAAADLERVVNGRTLIHDGHPILRQHLDNVRARIGTTGLKFMMKSKETDRIDGAIAAAMAVTRAAANDNQKSFWDSDDAESLAFIA